MTLYLGADLLDVDPNRPPEKPEHVERFGAVVGSPAGVFSPVWHAQTTRWTQTFEYWCRSRAELAALQTFVASRKGRYAPCWVPTWNDDIALTGGLAHNASTFTVRVINPAATALLGTGAQRHAAVLPRAGGVWPVRLGGIIDNGATLTVRLVTSYGGPALAAGTFRVSFLKYARLAEDAIDLDYSDPSVVIAALHFTELPVETP